MHYKQSTLTFVALWIVAVGTAGLAANVTSAAGWTVVAGLALVPAGVLLKLWKEPSQTMSESIKDALR